MLCVLCFVLSSWEGVWGWTFWGPSYISKRAGSLGPVTGSQFVLVISAVGVLYLQQLTIQLPYTQDVCNNGENAIMVLSCASIMAIQLGSIGSHRSLGWVAKTCGCQGLGSRVSLQSVWAWKLQRGRHHKPALTYSLSHESATSLFRWHLLWPAARSRIGKISGFVHWNSNQSFSIQWPP